MSQPERLTVSFVPSMGDVDESEWNGLLGQSTPFMRWDWLNLLETSGAVQPDTGWMPLHCTVRAGGELLAAAPLYVKGHGRGEFVYDQFWADVAARLGIEYYPKLVAVSPFTPVAGYRFLTAPGIPEDAACEVILGACGRLARSNGLSGLHVLFARNSFADMLEDAGLGAWEHQGFIWENKGYASFEDFLSAFRSGQRRNIRRERERLRQAGVRTVVVEGRDAPDSWFALMHHFYQDTNEKFGEFSCKFLPLAFFEGLADCFRERLAFSAAFAPGRAEPAALALLVHGDGHLYGRYWGAAVDIPFLHFDLCYYRPIEWAIAKGMKDFDPGMGGEHKPRRGFTSRVVRSLHRFHDPALSRVFAQNIGRINELTHDYIAELDALSAFKE